MLVFAQYYDSEPSLLISHTSKLFITEDKTTAEKKKTSNKDKIKKRLSIRSINFLKRKKKEDKEETNDSKNETKEDIPEEKAEEKVWLNLNILNQYFLIERIKSSSYISRLNVKSKWRITLSKLVC